LVLRSVLRVTTIGITVGIAGAFFLGRVLSSQFTSVRPDDAAVIVAAAALLAAVAVLPSLRPAIHATTIDPRVALRQE
jgi:putative ABC transport system permease protein